jgi:hypothetical protein
VIIRDLEVADEEPLRRIHAQSGLKYEFPKLESPLFIIKKVVVDDEQGRPVIAGCVKLLGEAQILCDPEWLTPAFRLKALELLHEEMRRELADKGIDEVVAFLPEEKKSFGRRLMRMFGWGKAIGECYARTV